MYYIPWRLDFSSYKEPALGDISLNDKIMERFLQLQDKSHDMRCIAGDYMGNYFERHDWLSWATSVEDLFKSAFGEHSAYYRNFIKVAEKCDGSESDVKALQSIFSSAKEAFEGGYIFDVERTISGEVLGDLVSLAKESLSEGHKDVASVLAAAALEDALKRFAKSNGLKVEGAVMSKVISAIKSKGLVTGAGKSMLDVMPKIRNHALHAEWQKISDADVNGVIGFVERFLLTEFSS